VCEGSGGPRAWPCISVPDQLRRRGHFASTFFNFRVLLHRCLHAIKPFLGPRYLPRRDATSENSRWPAKVNQSRLIAALGFATTITICRRGPGGGYGGRGSQELFVQETMAHFTSTSRTSHQCALRQVFPHLCIFNYCLAGAPSVLQFYSHRLIASFSTAPHGLLDEQLLASPTPVPTPRTTAKDGDSRREPEGRYWSALIDLRGPPGSFRSSHHVEAGIAVPEMA
jgi:hypothetical protein